VKIWSAQALRHWQANSTDVWQGGRIPLIKAPALTNLTSIQSLRGLAALAVAAAHLHSVELKFDAAPLLGNWATVGLGGVDLFFVISGFVMVWVTRTSQGDVSTIPRFWLARFLRIYPLWWLVLSVIVAVWMIKPEWVYSSNTVPPDLLRSYLLFPASGLPLHAVGWTLIHEVWFYLVFGALLVLPARLLPTFLVIWTTLVTLAALIFHKPANPVLALISHPLTLEFIIGAGIGLLATKRNLPAAKLILQMGCLVLLLEMISIRENPPAMFIQEWPRIALFGVPLAMILWGCVGLEQQGGSSPAWSQSLGNWSFALYLIHVPVFAAVGRLAAPLSRSGRMDNLVLIIFALASAIFAAFVLHVLFEKPIQKLSRHFLKRGNA
jgi:exopolysaccharide production protein ExoZ